MVGDSMVSRAIACRSIAKVMIISLGDHSGMGDCLRGCRGIVIPADSRRKGKGCQKGQCNKECSYYVSFYHSIFLKGPVDSCRT